MTAMEISAGDRSISITQAGLRWNLIRRLGSQTDLVRGETLAPDDGVLIESGAVALFSQTEGAATCVGLKPEGDLVGLIPAITARPSSLLPVVVADGSGLRYSRMALRREWETSAFFRDAVALDLQRTLDATQQWSVCASRHRSNARMATLLLRLSNGGAEDTIVISQETAARLLNVRRATVSEAVAELEAAKSIAWHRGGARIHDATRLEGLACACGARMRSQSAPGSQTDFAKIPGRTVNGAETRLNGRSTTAQKAIPRQWDRGDLA